MLMLRLKIVVVALGLVGLLGCGAGLFATTYSGLFIDAPTKGLTYAASPSGLQGTTDADGRFRFREGDSVAFSIVTPNGVISLGSARPATPPQVSQPSVVHAIRLDNGFQIAQVLQSLGGTGSVIDVSNITNLSANEVTQINSFISTGGGTATPARVTQSKYGAFSNAMDSIGSIPQSALPSGPGAAVSGAVVLNLGVIDGVVNSGSSAGQTFKFMVQEVFYFKPNGDTYALCINLPWIDPAITMAAGDTCDQAGIYKQGVWSIPAGSVNAFMTAMDTQPSSHNTVSVRYLDARGGFYTGGSSDPWDGLRGFTMSGTFLYIDTSFDKTYLAGKTRYLNGFSECSDGVLQFVYSQDGGAFSKTCKTARADGSPNTPYTGTITDGLPIPGLIQMTYSDGSSFFAGITAGSTAALGRVVIIGTGDSGCGTGAGYSLSRCGGVKLVSYRG